MASRDLCGSLSGNSFDNSNANQMAIPRRCRHGKEEACFRCRSCRPRDRPRAHRTTQANSGVGGQAPDHSSACIGSRVEGSSSELLTRVAALAGVLETAVWIRRVLSGSAQFPRASIRPHNLARLRHTFTASGTRFSPLLSFTGSHHPPTLQSGTTVRKNPSLSAHDQVRGGLKPVTRCHLSMRRVQARRSTDELSV